MLEGRETGPSSFLGSEWRRLPLRVVHQPLHRGTGLVLAAMSVSAAMGDAVVPQQSPEEQQSPPRPVSAPRRIAGVLTPRRVAAVIALVFLAVRLRRQLRYARLAIRHRRRLKLTLTVLVFLRQVRKGQLLGR